jgi:hypothetical protein
MDEIDRLIGDINKNLNLQNLNKNYSPIRRLLASERLKKTLTIIKSNLKLKELDGRPTSISVRILAGTFDFTKQGGYGDVVINEVIKTLNEFRDNGKPFVLRVDQQAMVAHLLVAFLPLIYKESLEANKDRLLSLLGVKEINELVFCITARRVGKTTCLAIFCATIMIALPASEGAIFSTGKRASQNLMGMIKKFLLMHPKGRAMMEAKKIENQEQLVLYGKNELERKILHAYPDSPDVCFFLFFIFF